MFLRFVSLVISCLVLAHCAGPAAPAGRARWTYSYIPQRTAVLYPNGRAWLQGYAPVAVHNAIAAGNRLVGKPYVWGGGHQRLEDYGYDCSGTVSYVLNYAGLLKGHGTSTMFRRFGAPGPGDWITVFAKDGHTFIEVAGLRLDTSSAGNDRGSGPRWTTAPRTLSGFRARHPAGL